MSKKPSKSAKPSAPNKAFVRKDPNRWKKAGWTSVPNSIVRDEDLPPIEAWAWTWLATHTEAFEVSGDALWRANNHVGRDKAYELLRSLEERGLLLRSHEVDGRGIPYLVYDLQPAPVPVEQRTAKPRKTKPKRKFPTKSTQPSKGQAVSDSWTVRNPAVTRDNAEEDEALGNRAGFLDSQESGSDQGQCTAADNQGESSKGGVFPDGSVPDGSGESYKEEKTNEEDQPTTQQPAEVSAPTARSSLVNAGWLESGDEDEPTTATDEVDADGVRLLRSLPLGIGDKLAGHAVEKWFGVVGAALRSGMDESVVIDKLTSGLPDNDVDKRLRIVVGRRLPDLKATVEQAPRRAAEREQSANEQAHARVDQWAQQDMKGAQQAAGLLGEYLNLDAHRDDEGAQEWLTEKRPTLARQFVEQRRDQLVDALTSHHAA